VATHSASALPEHVSSTSSIEQFAESIAASLAATAPAAEVAPEVAIERLSFRERVRRRQGIADLLVFRIGRELFAVELVAVEEALDMPIVHRLPEMPASMLGVFTLRGGLVTVFAPQATLGIPFEDSATVVVFSGADRRIALATDDVDDVLTVNLRTVRDAPGATVKDSALLGIVHRGSEMIALLDAQAIVAAHRALAAIVPDPAKESA
jgi:purine-binding chemotaxis protein CheW